jgi:hypothetical protein
LPELRRAMMVVKGTRVELELKDERRIVIMKLPPKWGMIHDPDGATRSKCEVFFAPFEELRKAAPDDMISARTKRYLGDTYDARLVKVDLPTGGWREEAIVSVIWYTRAGARGNRARNERYVHPFRAWAGAVRLSRSGDVRRITLGSFCVIDDRGFVFP